MSLSNFLTDLFREGQVRVPLARRSGVQADEVDLKDDLAASECLIERDRLVRLTLPGEGPAFHQDAALAGAEWLFFGCQLFADRARSPELFAQVVAHGLQTHGPSPEVVYSIDLALSYLPDLARHARQHAEEDPLMASLQRLAAAWPLSAVGIPGVPLDWERVHSWWENQSLRLLFLDRVLARDAQAFCRDARVGKCLRDRLGERLEELAGPGVLEVLSS